MSLISGFSHHIKEHNFNCAAPLLRMQLDNLIRLYASSLVLDRDDFVKQVMNGAEVRKLKDNSNQYLNDGYIVEKLSQHIPWFSKVYKSTSGYVHLSDKHIFNTFSTKPDSKFSAIVTDKDTNITEEERKEAADLMIEATKILLIELNGWTIYKDETATMEKKHGI